MRLRAAMAIAMGSSAEVSSPPPICRSASPRRVAGGSLGSEAATLLRVEGFGPSVAYRIAMR
jgi:glycolate oxidase FAD binding subunit